MSEQTLSIIDLGPDDWRDEHRRRLTYFGGELGLALHTCAMHGYGLGAQGGAKRHRPPNLLSGAVPKSVACKLLGVDRQTLSDMINDHVLRVVKWRGRTAGKVSVQRERVPMSEIERLVENGIPEPGEKRRRRSRRVARAADPAAAIRALEVDRL